MLGRFYGKSKRGNTLLTIVKRGIKIWGMDKDILTPEDLLIYKKVKNFKQKNWRKTKPGYNRKYSDTWKINHSDKWKEYMQNYREKHKEQIRANRKAYYQLHKNDTKKYATEWHRQNPDKAEAINRVNSANKKYKGKLTAEMVRKIIIREKRTCHWCGKTNLHGRDLTLEHLERINDPEKIVLACFSCNAKRIIGEHHNQYSKIEGNS